MYKNRALDGLNNLCGRNIRVLRLLLTPAVSQRALAERLAAYGVDIDKNAVQRIESGRRFVTDIELNALAKALGVPPSDLLLPPAPSHKRRAAEKEC